MLLALALIASPLVSMAHARCSLVALETTVHRTEQQLLRVDRWTWRVEAGVPDCVEVHVASPVDARAMVVSAELQRQDGRAPRLRGTRRSHVADSRDPGFGPAAGVVVHTPEAAEGDLLLIEVTRPWPAEAGGFTWRPGARGPLEIATLTVFGDVDVRSDGPELTDKPAAPIREWVVEDVPGGGPEPFDDGIAAPRGPGQVQRVEALLLPQRKPVRGLSDPERGRTLVAEVHSGALPTRVAWPADALASWCYSGEERSPCPRIGTMAWSLAGQSEAAWGYVRPGVGPSGQALLAGPAPRQTSRFTLLSPVDELLVTVPLVTEPDGLTLSHQPLAGTRGGLPRLLGLRPDQDLPPQLAELLDDALPLLHSAIADAADLPATTPGAVPHPRLTWRLLELEGEPLLSDAVAAQQAVAWLAIRASLPEPALPVELKGRKADATAIPELLALHHDRLHLGALPGQAALQPRKLMKVRRSGYGTAWEQALILTRYLQQLKLGALPVPVRPQSLGPADPASLTDWPLALVRVQAGDQVSWLDPTCPTCGADELRPAFDQAAALSPELSVLPALAPSTWRREVTPVDAGLQVDLSIEGPLAVELRALLASVDGRARGRWLARKLVGEGARLESHQGLVTGGGPIELSFTAASDIDLVPPLEAPPREGEPQVVLPARGSWIERRVLPGHAAGRTPLLATRWLGAQADGLIWRRTLEQAGDQLVIEESLVVEGRVLQRAPAAALLGRLSQSWGQLPPAPAESVPSPGSLPPGPAPPGGP